MAKRRRLTPDLLCRWIGDITTELVGTGLVDDQNWPMLRHRGEETNIGTPHAVDRSVLRDTSYLELYLEQRESRSFNLLMLDGALVQLSYGFESSNLVRHRLAFFPSPDLTAFQNDSELYLGEWPFAEVVGTQVAPVAIRFDYDVRDGVATDIVHPKSHLTLGQYRHCRIPVTGPLGPATFMEFILRHFYSSPEIAIPAVKRVVADGFNSTITDAERGIAFVSIPRQ